ncbi:SPOR domain-containing protein [Acinetobacter qingfengensis]|uniref:SPOR domain-containing protein n=1 Tax=Acinetobacter qingfengensis TaxID=1262585 RepID=A0A1E7RF15_9GAMM|nr:SPOR domain-containing protein [Acinetobacter qingfengensis]KAA8731886.1 SPOR domain-containing protein [Acinetobacter qingfengensis]OEY97990.1 hypothetical protein BJI46_00205 [Acinetobacter qingfengensis]
MQFLINKTFIKYSFFLFASIFGVVNTWAKSATAEQDCRCNSVVTAKKENTNKKSNNIQAPLQNKELRKMDTQQARQLLENGEQNWMVQVALASNQAGADRLTKQIKAKGYNVVQSFTSKGIRIMVEPLKSQESAEITRRKIAADKSLNLESAWVIQWTNDKK